MRLRATRLSAIAHAARVALGVPVSWSPTSWFSASEQGLWYDPTDLTRYMGSLGSELVTNGNFSSAAGWTLDTNWTISGGQLSVDQTGSYNNARRTDVHTQLVAGRRYLVTYTVVSLTTGTPGLLFKGGVAADQTTAVGTRRFIYTADGTENTFTLGATTVNVTCTFDNISVRELTAINTATMYQDSAGTTPVTAVEQPVGLILDRRLGALGALTTLYSTDFSTSTNWNTLTNATISGGTLNLSPSATAVQSTAPTIGALYKVTYTITAITPGSGNIRCYVGSTGAGVARTTTGTFTEFIVAAGATSIYFFTGSGFVSGSVDNLSVELIPGNHALQATSTARPTLRNRYNLLTFSEQFDNAAWTKQNVTITANSQVAPDGTTTADTLTDNATSGEHRVYSANVTTSQLLGRIIYAKAGTASFIGVSSGNNTFGYAVIDLATGSVAESALYTVTVTAAGDGWYQIRMVGQVSESGFHVINMGTTISQAKAGVAYVGSGSTIHIWGAQLTTAADASLPYQRIAAVTDYDSDASKFPLYLAFDGSDDSLATGSVNFSATDKMTVVAGVTKLSDTNAGSIVGLSSAAAGTNGTFELMGPSNAAGANYRWFSRGTSNSLAAPGGFAAPVKRVLAGSADIGGDVLKFRVNGVEVANESSDQGTGNYSNNQVFIGARGLNTYFNGRIHQLIIRGAASTDIAQAESFVAARTGVTL